MPSPKIYASGDSIPLTLTLSCSKLPSLPQLLVKVDSLDICLIRRAKITATIGSTVQETLVSKAELQYTDHNAEGVSRSRWVLQLGQTQRHLPWNLDGLAEVKVWQVSSSRSVPNGYLSDHLASCAQYLIRVSFRPPPCSVIKQLPPFQHDEAVKLTSDPWLDPVMADELRHLPSLGLAPVGLTDNRLAPPNQSLSSPSTRL